ncbi:MAG TPA: hypothetical protein DCR40_16110 [Prolixibacteraceae bacterium]|nr:hypothetical protein [Prolixibacteraceae bacterium]
MYDKSDGRTFVLDLEDVKKFLNLNKRGQKPSIDGYYTDAEPKKENMMNVGELDQKFFTKPDSGEKRNRKRRRPQGNRPQGNRPEVNMPTVKLAPKA